MVLVVVGVLLRITVLTPSPIDVEVFHAEVGLVEETVTNSRAGTVRSRRDAQLSVETVGRVVEICKREGEAVKAGDELIKLDETEAIAALELAGKRHETAKARVKEAVALLAGARIELERNKNLASVSEAIIDRLEKKVDAAEAVLLATRATVAQEKAALEMATAQRKKVVLKAPFDGVLAERHIELGEWAVPGRPVMRLVDLNAIYVEAELDEIDLERVKTGMPVRVKLDPFRGQEFEGRVVRVAPFVSDVETQNRTVEIEVEFVAEFPGLKPGTSADVFVILDRTDEALRIPAYALLEGGRVLLAADGVATSRQVEIGLKNWEFVEVRSGLSAGDPVIISLDREEVKDGARIQVQK